MEKRYDTSRKNDSVAQFQPEADPPLAGVEQVTMYHVYFLQSRSSDKYYVGMTGKDPQDRLVEHNRGSNDWTKHNGPFELVYYESYVCKEDAARREIFYKSGFGRKIRDLILGALEENKNKHMGR